MFSAQELHQQIEVGTIASLDRQHLLAQLHGNVKGKSLDIIPYKYSLQHSPGTFAADRECARGARQTLTACRDSGPRCRLEGSATPSPGTHGPSLPPAAPLYLMERNVYRIMLFSAVCSRFCPAYPTATAQSPSWQHIRSGQRVIAAGDLSD